MRFDIGSPVVGLTVSAVAVLVALVTVVPQQLAEQHSSAAESPVPIALKSSLLSADGTGASPPPVHFVSAGSKRGDARAARFQFGPHWERVSGFSDGRVQGKSARAFSDGAVAVFQFKGSQFFLYGVTGPSGGSARIRIDGAVSGDVSFYSTRKVAKALVYTSAGLPAATHTVQIVVAPPSPDHPRRRYVNINGALYAAS